MPRKRTSVAALVSTAALLAVGVQSVPANAQPAAPIPAPSVPGDWRQN